MISLVQHLRNLTDRATRPILRAHLATRGVELEGRVHVNGRPHIWRAPGSTIRLGDGVVLSSGSRFNTLEARGPVILRTLLPSSSIEVGSFTGMSSATISSAVRIRIGNRVLIGGGVLITDSDHHPVDIQPIHERRFAGLAGAKEDDEVVIEDDVFIGARAIVLKGTRIGPGSVIGAGSVVSGTIPGGVVAAGNPCRILRELRGV